ncbi:FG-GAP repeat domain-containing protein [Micromonospora eburnea]|uniref:Ig-like domain (Group 3) n=1 Tax=Micromonospora eburnea TaxID=227316 RepID=A0A1C6UY70_9ACTN|nr:VCBS repeat-containing protein [Micromonospora eburnea]SCL58976.1 Ig-like domain (group 3) [Micromonospora eburnea]
MRNRWFRGQRHARRTGCAGVVAAVLVAPAVTMVAIPASPARAAGCDTLGFTAGPVTAAAGQPRDIEVADSNHNGFDDLLIADASGDGNVRQLIASGTGGFWPGLGPDSPPEVYPTSGSPNAIAVGFFNDDTEPDFAAATTDGVSLWFGAAGGEVSYGPGGLLLDGRNVPDVAVIDANRDLRSDIAALDPAADELKIFRNLNSAGSFDDRLLISHPRLFAAPKYLAAGDLTGNGVPDYVVSSFNEKSVTVFRNNLGSATRLNGLGEAWRPALADFDLDGNLDVAVAFPNDDKVRLWRGSHDPQDRTASAGFGNLLTELSPLDLAPLTPDREVPHDVDVADLNVDGKPDLVVVGAGSHAVYVYPGNGDGTFSAPLTLTAGSRPVQAAVGRFDNNQSLDIVVADEVDGTVRTYLNGCTAPEPNLTVKGMEVTQVIQDLANSVDLIADRRTIVRAYVGTSVASPAVTATLQAFRPDGTPVGVPVRPSNPGGALVPEPNLRRNQLDGGFFFELPLEWTSAGDLTLRLEVNPDHRVPEPGYADNVRTETVHFNGSNPVKVELVKFGYKRNGQWVLPPDSRLDQVESLLRRTLPASRIVVNRSEHRDDYPYFWIGEDGTWYPRGNDASSVLERYSQNTAGTRRPGVIYVVLVDRRMMGGLAEDIPGWVAVSGQDVDTASHEVGHLLGRYHVQCTPDPNDEATPSPPWFPYPGGSIGGPDPTAPSFAGFDQGDASLGLPQRVVWAPDGDPVVGDTMSYCHDRWPSDATYEAWRARIQSAFPAADPTGDFLALSGTIDPAAETATLTGQRIPQCAYLPTRQPGPYAFRLLDADGATLAEYAFTPRPAGEATLGLGFGEIVDFAPGTRRVALIDTATGDQLASLAVSAGRPTASLAGDPLPETLPASGPVPVSWTASDPDGDPVTASLLYSGDDGQNWTVVASGLSGGSYTVDASVLPGTGGAATGRLRVRVTDGVNTADATSGALTVGGKTPTVRITAPLRGAAFAQGQTVTLAATTGDLEQGTLSDNEVSWSSNIDGDLGTGSVISPGQLSAGTHTITVTATDRDGAHATAQTLVTVGRTIPAGSPPVADAGPDQTAAEGDTVTLDASGTADPDGDLVTLSWSVVRQPASHLFGAAVRLDGPAERPSFQALESGTYRFRLTATDARHGTTSDDVTVTVGNKAPSVTITAPAENALLPVGPATVRTSFTDPGVLDTHTCTVEWDIDQPIPAVSGTVAEQAGTGTCTASRILEVGVYSVRVTVTDDEGAASQATRQIVVYDPTAGFVTGGGWITSPAGAYPAGPTATGKATFGFVSRYKKGDSIPSGETDFRLAVGGLHFSGTAYRWLVVTGARAQYRGEGTVNGKAGYAFLVTVGDGRAPGGGGIDRFRIKVWETATGNVVYDNVPGAPDDIDSANPQAISQGSVVIHR